MKKKLLCLLMMTYVLCSIPMAISAGEPPTTLSPPPLALCVEIADVEFSSVVQPETALLHAVPQALPPAEESDTGEYLQDLYEKLVAYAQRRGLLKTAAETDSLPEAALERELLAVVMSKKDAVREVAEASDIGLMLAESGSA